MSRKIDELVPELQEKYAEFKDAMEDAELKYIVTQTRRTQSEQTALYAQGRKTLEEVNELRKAVGWPALKPAGNIKVTWTMKSKHLQGKAFDIAMIGSDGKVSWSNFLFDKAGKVGESVGLEWGGSWEKKDRPHFQLKEA
jgi:peptidoglycan L-alanyl-D-glutamate endopeptidase CwlK